jgi:hypothetical protein
MFGMGQKMDEIMWYFTRVLRLYNNCEYSWLVNAHGNARLAGNGLRTAPCCETPQGR